MNSDQIILFIENRRKELDISTNELASKIGYSSQLVYNWSKGKSLPDISVLYVIGNVLGITIEDIFNANISNLKKENKSFDIDVFSKGLKKLRVFNSVTQKELGEKVGVSYATIIAWEKGSSTPNINQFILLCKIYSVSYSELYYGEILKKVNSKSSKKHSLKPLKFALLGLTICLVVGGIIGSIVAFNLKASNTFTARFLNEDGTSLLWSKQFDKNEPVVYGGLFPKKDATGPYPFEFNGWEETEANKIDPSLRISGNVKYYLSTFITATEFTDPSEFSYSFEQSGCVISKYNGSLEEVVIPNQINGENVIAIEETAFFDKNIKKVVIPCCLKSIGEHCFKNCFSLEKAVFSDDLETIGDRCFSSTRINSFIFPKGLINFGANVFSDCLSLSYVEIYGNVSKLISSFRGCHNLKTIVIPEGIKELTGTFYESGIESISLPNTLEILGEYAFCNMPIKYIELPDSLKTIKAFNFCLGERIILVPKNLEYWDFDIMCVPAPDKEVPQIFFKGNKEDWNKITFPTVKPNMDGKENIHFYSETDSPNCWHYVNGVPTLY